MAKKGKGTRLSPDFLNGFEKQADGSYKKIGKDIFGQNSVRVIESKDFPSTVLTAKIPAVETKDFEHAPVTEWFIPYQTPSKKNSRSVFVNKKTGKMMNIPSEAYRNYIKATKKYWEVFGIEFKQSIARLELKPPYHIHMTFTRSTKQVLDYFGPGESIFDLMSDFGWWEDDNTKVGKPHFGDIIVDKNNPGVRIKLLLKEPTYV